MNARKLAIRSTHARHHIAANKHRSEDVRRHCAGVRELNEAILRRRNGLYADARLFLWWSRYFRLNAEKILPG